MSEVMLHGVLNMPYELAMSDELSRYQFHARAQEASQIILTQEAKIEAFRARIAELEKRISDYGWEREYLHQQLSDTTRDDWK